MTAQYDKTASKARMISMVFILGAAYFLSNFHRYCFGVLGEFVALDFGLSVTQLGLLGAAVYYAYAVMQLPSGVASDKLPTKAIIVLACLFSGLGTIWFASAGGFGSLVVARVATGAAVAFVYASCLATIRQWFGDKSLGSMTGILVAMGQLGAVFASAPLKLSADAIGWQGSFIVLGVLSIAIALAVLLVVPGRSRSLEPKARKAGGDLRTLIAPAFLSLLLWFFIIGGTRYAIRGLWGADFFTKVLLLSSDQSSLLMMWMTIGSITGALAMGWLSDVLGNIRTAALCGFALAAAWAGFVISDAATPVLLVYAFSTAVGFFGAGGFTVGFACIREFASSGGGGMLIGVINCAAFMGSALLTQFTGKFLETMLAGQYSLGQSFYVLFIAFAALCAGSTLLLPLLAKRKCKDANSGNQPFNSDSTLASAIKG